MNGILDRQGNVLARGIITLDLSGDVFRRFWVAERHVRGGASGGYQLLGKLAEPMSHLERKGAVHEVPPAELVRAGVVCNPREPIVPDLEGRRVGDIDVAEAKLAFLRHDLAELGRHVPAATPVLQEP